ncbi:hypothetical protein HHI36_019195, partial [Cryptolaemus montrouzieri]
MRVPKEIFRKKIAKDSSGKILINKFYEKRGEKKSERKGSEIFADGCLELRDYSCNLERRPYYKGSKEMKSSRMQQLE